jgi:hypothetical protein
MNAHRVSKRVIRLTVFNTAKRGNWFLRFSYTNMGTFMIIAKSILAPENMFVRYFSDEEEAVNFAEFLVSNDFYNPYPEIE